MEEQDKFERMGIEVPEDARDEKQRNLRSLNREYLREEQDVDEEYIPQREEDVLSAGESDIDDEDDEDGEDFLDFENERPGTTGRAGTTSPEYIRLETIERPITETDQIDLELEKSLNDHILSFIQSTINNQISTLGSILLMHNSNREYFVRYLKEITHNMMSYLERKGFIMNLHGVRVVSEENGISLLKVEFQDMLNERKVINFSIFL